MKNILDTSVPWYEIKPKTDKLEYSKLTKLELFEKAKQLYEEAVGEYQKSQKGSEKQWFKDLGVSGTSFDKISGFTLAIQSAPIFHLEELRKLLAITAKKNRRESILALSSIQDLMINNILPNRKLEYFDQKNPRNATLMIVSYFEDCLKKLFFEFVTALEVLSNDTILFGRIKAASICFDLLCNKPEQEQNLLLLLVNKLGDNDRKIASKVSFLLSNLLLKHPGMALIVIKEVQQLIERPNASSKAQYYGLLFLSQLILTKNHLDVANKLVNLYLNTFSRLCANEKSSQDHKIIGALLTGVNRAFPFSSLPSEIFERHLDSLFKISHDGNFNTSIQAMSFLFQICSKEKEFLDRYYKALYDMIFDERIERSSKQSLFFNLLNKSCVADNNENRIKAFVKRIFQACQLQKVPFICASMILLSSLIKQRPSLAYLFDNPNGTKTTIDSYDPKKRDPQFASAETSFLWELDVFTNHFHPTVCKFAATLLAGSYIPSSDCNPFQTHTITMFLEKFVTKNPKKAPKELSIMQRQGSQPIIPLSIKYAAAAATATATGDNKLSVPEDEEYFYKFAVENSRKAVDKKKAKDSDGDVHDEEIDRYFDEIAVPAGEGEDEDEENFTDEDIIDDDGSFGGNDSENVSDMDMDMDTNAEEIGDDDDDESSENTNNAGSNDESVSDKEGDFFDDNNDDDEEKPKKKKRGWQYRAETMGIPTDSLFLDADLLAGNDDDSLE